MNKSTKIRAIVLTQLLFLLSVFAQIPPGDTNGDTNLPPFIFNPPSYVPGLKVSISPVSGTNLPINLLEADPAGKYAIFYASNLISPLWSDIIQGTNGQTNFTLTIPQSDTGFFRTARTDTPITNAANVTVSLANYFVNSNLITANISGGPAVAMAVLINSTNFSDPTWIPFSASPYVLLGTNDGVYDIWFGFYGSDGIVYWTEASVILDTTPPTLVITNPTTYVTSKPMIQLEGYSTEPLTSLTFAVTNSQETNFYGDGLVTSQFFDTNLFDFTTNWFECLDIGLTQGTNYVFLQAVDRAGNVATTNLTYIFDTNGDTTPPAITLFWPQSGTQICGTNFTLRGMLDDETASLTAQIVSTNGTTNIIAGIVERDGDFWAENLPLAPGTNLVTVIATDAAGNSSVTNICVSPSAIALTIDPPSSNQLWDLTLAITGTINSSNYSIWVNGVEATLNGSGTWTASNVYLPSGGTAVIQARAISNSDNGGDGTGGSGGGPIAYDNLGNPVSALASDAEYDTDRPPYLFVQSYWLNYQAAINGYQTNPFGIQLTKVNETIAMNWDTNGGSSEYDYIEVLDFRAASTLDVDQSIAWPPDVWTPTLGGTQTSVITGQGQTFTQVTNVGPPSIPWESCNIQGTAYYDYAGEVLYPQSYTRSAQTVAQYFTGGKSTVLRENLHQLNVGVNQQIFVPGFDGGSETTGAAITNGITAGAFGPVTNGVAYKLLPDGQTVDVTPQVQGVSNYNFTLSWARYLPVILSLNTMNTSGTNLTIGDNLNFPSPIYGIPQNLLNKVTPNDPLGCQGYFGKVEVIGQVNPNVPLPTIFTIGQWRYYYIEITFNDGSPPEIVQGSVLEDPMNYQQDIPNTNWNIFAIDGPGIPTVGYTNIATIFERQNFTTYTRIGQYKCSNFLQWHNETTVTNGVIYSPTDVGGGHIILP